MQQKHNYYCVNEEKAEFSLVAEEGFEPPTFGL